MSKVKPDKKKKSLASEIVASAEKRKKESAAEGKKAEKEKQAKAAEAAGMKLMVAVEKGRATANQITGLSALQNMQDHLAKGFTLTSTGLTLKKGVNPTDDEWGTIIGGFLQATEGFKKAAGSSMWAAGDACLMVKESRGPEEADNLLANIAKDKGIEPHSIQIAINTCSFYKPDERNSEASFTMHVEGVSYSKKGTAIRKDTLLKMIDTASKDREVVVVGKDGKESKRHEPISVREFRERLQEKVGKKPKDKEETPNLYFYVAESGDVKYSLGLDLALTKRGEHLVIDATEKVVINDKGALHFAIQALESNVVPIKEEPKAEAPKKAEAPTPKTKKVASAGIPD